MISVIVTTRNEEKNIKRLLISLKKQSFKDFEIIVVDNHSQDKTFAIAKKFTSKVYLAGPERSAQRNFGLKKARGNYILFLDADMELEKDVLEQCFKRIQAPKTAAIIIHEESKGKNMLAKIKALEKEIYKDTQIEAARFFKKKDLLKIGGYDQSLIAAEDWDLTKRIKKLDKLETISAKIFHWETDSIILDLKKKYYYAKNIQRYAQKNPETFKKQASFESRLKILLQKPKLIFRNPFTFLALLTLKFLQYTGYFLAKSQIISKLTFAKNQTKALLNNTNLNIKRLKTELRTRGLNFVLLKSLPHLAIFVGNHFFYKSFKTRTFKFNGKKYQYFYGMYNFTYFGERCVEIPIIKRFIDEENGNILEIGNVLSHYFPINHDVLDKYEKGPNVINQDIVNFSPTKKYDLICSISTIEHVGWDEKVKNPEKIILALQNIKDLLNQQCLAVITLPIGYNPYLDEILKAQRKKLFNRIYCLKRISKDNKWKEVTFKNIQQAKFNYPYPFANAILIGIIKK